MKHYPHHIGDFDRATRHLTRIERSIYRDLIDLYYDTEERLTLDMALLCRKIIARSNEESTAVEQVLNEFFTETPTGWYHDRCEAEIESYHANTSQKAMAGKASAKAKRLKKLNALNGKLTTVEQPLNSVVTDDNGTPTNHQPSTINQEPINTGASAKRGKPAAVMPEGVTESVWLDFLAIRKAKRAPLTPTALDDIQREASKAGMELQQVLQMCCARGWQGFSAEWAASAKTGATTSQALSFAERDELAKRKRWEEMTGRTWPTSGRPPELTDINVINQLALEAS